MKLKKVLASILCMAMVLSTMSFAVLADEEYTATDAQTITAAVAELNGEYYASLSDAVANASDDDTIEILNDIADETVTVSKSVSITSEAGVKHTLDNVIIKTSGAYKLAVSDLKFTGDSYIDATGGDALKVTGCEATVNPAKITGRSAFIVLSTNEQKTSGLKLTVEGNTIVNTFGQDFYGAAIFGWAYLADGSSISNNVFGSEDYRYRFIAVKTMNAVNGAKIAIENNTVYGTNEYCNFSAFDLYQNCSRDNEYTVISNKNKIDIDTKDNNYAARAFYIETKGTGGNAVVYDNGTKLNDKAITMADFKIENQKKFAGVDVELDENGRILSGTFNVVPDEKYIATGYYAVENLDGTYTVKVKDTAKSEEVISNTVTATVYSLAEDENGNKTAIPTTVEVTLDAETVVAVSGTYLKVSDVTEEQSVGDDSKAYDISFVDDRGDTVDFSGTATVKIPYTATGAVKVFWLNGSEKVDMNAEYDSANNQITFTTNHFSTYIIQSEDDITDEIAIQYKKADDNNYDVYAVANAGKIINRLSSAQLEFNLNVTAGNVNYELTPATDISITGPDADGYYLFNYDGTVADSDVVAEVKLGTVTFTGYGTFEFSTTDEDNKAKVHTAKFSDNIVNDYTVTDETLVIAGTSNADNENDEYGYIIGSTLKPATQDLTINIAYNNAISNNVAEYQDMKVVISGGDLAANLEYNLGSEFADTANETLTYTDSAYELAVANKLTQNVAYTVTVSGAGYRTARYTVTMTADKTLNFWNNVKDNAVEVETGKESSKVTKNFLAGDIVKDNQINIYDLSAVVSYFGTENLTTSHPEYAKYDLNRDGVIDSKDVAYVLVSWGN